MSQANKVVGAAFLLMGVTIISRLIGFIRELFIANYFGTEEFTDIFVLAQTIPVLLLTIAGGALSAALVPMIIRLKNQNEETRLKRLVSSLFSMTSLVMVGISVVLYVCIEPFTRIYARGLDEQGIALLVDLLKVIIPTFVAIGLISLFTAILNAHKHYLIPSLGPIFISLGVILAAVFFSRTYGIKGLMVGITLGVFAHLLFAYIATVKKKVLMTPKIYWNDDVKQVITLMLPILISVSAFQINTVVDRTMASTLEKGSVAALYFANKVVQLPLSLFLGAMVLPLFPMLAEKLSKQDFQGTNAVLSRAYRLLGIILLPITCIFIVMAEPIISVIFLRGKFTEESVVTTSIAFVFYSFMLFPYAMRDVMNRAFYSLQDTWTPVIDSVILVGLNIILMIVLVPQLGIVAIAGSTSFSYLFAAIRLKYKLNKKIGTHPSPKSRQTWLYILLNTILFTLVTWSVYHGLLYVLDQPQGIQLYIRTFGSLALGGIFYLWLTFRLETEEVEWIKQQLRQLLGKITKRLKTN